MKFLPLCLSLVASATFIPDTRFPDYLGNRDTLARVIAISGTIANGFPQDARCLDDVLTEEHLLAMARPLRGRTLKLLGELLGELSPARFDSFCSELDRFGKYHLKGLVRTYGNEHSKWKRAFGISKKALVTAENAPYHRGANEDLCLALKDNPSNILTASGRRFCLEYWSKRGKGGPVRAMVRAMPAYLGFLSNLDSYVGHADEYVAYLKIALEKGVLRRNSMSLSPDLKNKHMKDIQKTLKARRSGMIPKVVGGRKKHEGIVGEINEIFEHQPIPLCCNRSKGFDCEPFMGKWAMAKQMDLYQRGKHPYIYTVSHVRYPTALNHALNIALRYGNFEVLDNTLLILRNLCPSSDLVIPLTFKKWFDNNKQAVCSQGKNYQVRNIFARLKGHVIFVIGGNFGKGEARNDETESSTDSHTAASSDSEREDEDGKIEPFLYRDMVENPGLYFPEHQIRQGVDWAGSILKEIHPIETGKKDAEGMNDDNIDLDALNNIGQILSALVAERGMQVQVKNGALKMVSLNNFDSPKQLHHELQWIALSSNQQLLDEYLDRHSPSFILSLCHHPQLRSRISLMMHLSYKTRSYKSNGEPVDKNSLFFRDWVMIRLPNEIRHVADFKLLHYYFANRILRNYPGFELHSADRVFGLLGHHQDDCDSMRAQDLSFDSPDEEKMTDVDAEKENQAIGAEKEEDGNGSVDCKPS